MAKDYWETPYDVVANIELRLDTTFTIDVACEEHNAKAAVAVTSAMDCNWFDLQQQHGGAIWCNPPYSDPAPWVNQFARHAVTGAMLVNAGTSAKWFHTALAHASELLIPDSRIGFYDPDIGTIQTRNDRSQVIFIFSNDRSKACQVKSVPIGEIQSIRDAATYRQQYGHRHTPSTLQRQLAELSAEGL